MQKAVGDGTEAESPPLDLGYFETDCARTRQWTAAETKRARARGNIRRADAFETRPFHF